METKNIAETLAEELRSPVDIDTGNEERGFRRVGLPKGWSVQDYDDERLLEKPRRKKAKVAVDDVDSLIAYVNRHAEVGCTIWCKADYAKSHVGFTAILNDHERSYEVEDILIANKAQWRDHRAAFLPRFSEEWNRWHGKDGEAMGQAEFAMFLEDNIQDVAAAEGMPTGSQMLEMALSFEAKQDMRFKSSIRLQSGGANLHFVQDDDKGTVEQMKLFDRFSIGIPVYWNGDAYRIDARLRYRVRDGVLKFWFELIRADKVMQDATQTLIEKIKVETGRPFFFGDAFI